MKIRSWHLWSLAFLVTIVSAIYQRLTGPTYPVKGKITLSALEVSFKLPRSHAGKGDAEIRMFVPDATVTGTMEFRRFRSRDPWSRQPLEREGDYLIARIPHQPPAGKVIYSISLSQEGANPHVLTSEPVIIRFRGEVPSWVLVPHILLMFAAMLFSSRAGLEALVKGSQIYQLTLWTCALLFVGGFILGPLMQKYAFNTFWTGWPLGYDLTDNKTAVAMLLWLLALWRSRKNQARAWALAASMIMLAVYFIPHSVWGSEIDYTQAP